MKSTNVQDYEKQAWKGSAYKPHLKDKWRPICLIGSDQKYKWRPSVAKNFQYLYVQKSYITQQTWLEFIWILTHYKVSEFAHITIIFSITEFYKIQMLTHALKNLHTNLNYQIRNIYFQALRHANAFQTASKKFDNEIYIQIP